LAAIVSISSLQFMARPSSPSTRAAASSALSLPDLGPALVAAFAARAFLTFVPLAAASVFVRAAPSFFVDMVVLPMIERSRSGS
jgi:hypothetical protein